MSAAEATSSNVLNPGNRAPISKHMTNKKRKKRGLGKYVRNGTKKYVQMPYTLRFLACFVNTISIKLNNLTFSFRSSVL